MRLSRSLFLCGAAALLIAAAPAPDEVQEKRAQALFRELRCVVCHGQSIAESQADIAADIRRAVRQRIAAGESNHHIKDALVEAYGPEILLRPPLKAETLGLWFGPALIFIGGGVALFAYFFSARTSRR